MRRGRAWVATAPASAGGANMAAPEGATAGPVATYARPERSWRIASTVMVAALLLIGTSARLLACPVCFQVEQGPVTDGVRAAVLVLVGVTLSVLSGFGVFVARFVARERSARSKAITMKGTKGHEGGRGYSRAITTKGTKGHEGDRGYYSRAITTKGTKGHEEEPVCCL
jgi:hypothetical protein